VRDDLHVNQGAIFPAMSPEASVIASLLHGDDILAQERAVFVRAEVHDGHVLELTAGKPVARHGGIIDRQERPGCHVQYPHRMRIALKQQSVACLAFLQRPIRPVALDPHPQHRDAEGEIAGEFAQQGNLVTVEGIRCRGVDAQGAQCLLPEDQRQGAQGGIATFDGLGPPGRETGIGGNIRDHAGAAGTNRRPIGATPTLGLRPGAIQALEIACFMTGVCHRPHAAGGVVLGITHPGHPIAADLDDDAADGAQQLCFIGRPNQRLVTLADHSQLPVGPAKRLLGPHALGDVYGDTDHLERIVSCPHRIEIGVEEGVTEAGDELQRLAGERAPRLRSDLRVTVIKREQGLTNRLAGRQTGTCQPFAFAEFEHALLIELKNYHWRVADQRPVARLAGRQVALALTNGQRHAIKIVGQTIELPDLRKRPGLIIVALGNGMCLRRIAANSPCESTRQQQGGAGRQEQRHQRASSENPKDGLKRLQGVAARLRDEHRPAELRHADQRGDERLTVQFELMAHKAPAQGIADDRQMTEVELLAAKEALRIGDDLALAIEDQGQHPRFGRQATDELGEPVNRDFADQDLIGHRNRQTDCQPAADSRQKNVRPHRRLPLASFAQYRPAREVDRQQVFPLAPLSRRQANRVHGVIRVRDIDRREDLPGSHMRIENRFKPERRRLKTSLLEILGDSGQLAPGTAQVHLDLAGDGASQRLVTGFDLRQHLRQQHPQEQRGNQQQRQHACQQEAQRQPWPKGLRPGHRFTRHHGWFIGRALLLNVRARERA
jgi:hypothetical protein